VEKQNLLKMIEEFVSSAIECKNIRERIEIKLHNGKGFYVQWIRRGESTHYTVFVPEKLAKLSVLTRLSLLHELGHVLFNEMYYNEYGTLANVMTKMRKKRWFSFLEKFYYWNPLIRKIKSWFGFSFPISYKASDLYDENFSEDYREFTRADNEFFCDYFAVFIKNWDRLRVFVTN